jgi:hypothetical protein
MFLQTEGIPEDGVSQPVRGVQTVRREVLVECILESTTKTVFILVSNHRQRGSGGKKGKGGGV